jgi:hypothetical protein
MSESTKFQVNFKTPQGTLINFYAETVVDGVALLNEFAGAWPVIQKIQDALHPVAPTYVAPVAPVEQFPSEPAWGGPAAAPAVAAPAPAAAPSQGAHTCRHGAMTYRSGSGAKGPWQAYFCPAPKGAPDQCEPHFLR